MFDHQVKDFWLWFDENQKKLGDDIHNLAFLQEIDRIISDWGLGWEIGPGISKLYSITVSPSSDPLLLENVQFVVKQAPEFENWEVFSFKQPKSNWDTVILPDKPQIDASAWKYRLLLYPDNDIEIELRADSIRDYSDDDKSLIADLVITNLLGEETKMKSLCNILCVENFDSESGVTDIQYLPAHLAECMNRNANDNR